MERIFWVECPECRDQFYANYQDMRASKIKLYCPFCRHRFGADEAAAIDERAKPEEVE